MIDIYYTSFSAPFSNEIWTQYLHSFSLEIQQKILRYRMEKNQYQALLGKLLLQKILSEHQIPQLDLSNLKYTEKGKPYLENVPFSFNISHSENTIMCAFSEKAVGVDVEKMKEMQIENFKNFFSPSEIAQIQASSNPKHAFFSFWTLKEAILKLTGEGISANLLNFHIQSEKAIYFEKTYFYETEILSDDFIFTVAANEKIEKKLQYISF